ncbi:HotDog domain-containing protein [Mycena rosella]|uniref:HotDog domain-containing protein n=1 Tax=Mycena rosella TaxID=1033263 RepID=A0AAD7CLV2_MYCRO|nr:HotDog domain-containing protein [Mycena rosella]
MATPPWEAFLRALPTAPGVDAAQIAGNVPAAQKQLNANILAYFTTGSGRTPFPPFASDIARRLRIVAFDVWGDAAEIGLEITVTESMCNVYGTMHGGCAVYILDAPSVAAGVLLGLAKGFDGTGVSQSMNIHWHHPAPLGATLAITTRCIFADGRARLSRCEMRDKTTGQLIVSSTHAFLNAGRAVKL